uniref:Transmembrane protein n=3 Tax=Cupriavidus TaxID=106589 RepID=Q46SG0_CUPPJ
MRRLTCAVHAGRVAVAAPAKSEPAYASLRRPPMLRQCAGNYIDFSRLTARRCLMSFALYLIGLLVLVGGIAWGLSIAGLAPVYIGIACLIVLGLGIMGAVSRTRTKDS